MTKRNFVEIDGYFEFSKPVPSESDLDEWKKWFDAKGIKHKTVKIGRMFVLYREGVKAKAMRKG
jgi:hypothetical protein